jgi:hypothetical protein
MVKREEQGRHENALFKDYASALTVYKHPLLIPITATGSPVEIPATTELSTYLKQHIIIINVAIVVVVIIIIIIIITGIRKQM